ncbi:hypothetical protein [Paenibacillus durus]|uniref:hypothetical protein n=1 Tax=Paenibacillus durus TaxID=44251 RepID=UPI000B05FF4C|nr:hypothetical protein [Paenibacillus durus]
MWFLNTETGCIWEVVDQELIQRLRANAIYEQVDEPKKEVPKTPEVKNTKRNDKEPT